MTGDVELISDRKSLTFSLSLSSSLTLTLSLPGGDLIPNEKDQILNEDNQFKRVD